MTGQTKPQLVAMETIGPQFELLVYITWARNMCKSPCNGWARRLTLGHSAGA